MSATQPEKAGRGQTRLRIVRIGGLLVVLLPITAFLFPGFGDALWHSALAVRDSVRMARRRNPATSHPPLPRDAKEEARVAQRIEGSTIDLFSTEVRALARWGDGIAAGGLHYPGIGIVRMDSSGHLDRVFTDRAANDLLSYGSGYVNRIVVAPDGSFTILIGSFGTIPVLKLMRDGHVDRGFLDALAFFNESYSVYHAAVLHNGDVALTGGFWHRRSAHEVPEQWRLAYVDNLNRLVTIWPSAELEVLRTDSFLAAESSGSLLLQSSLRRRDPLGMPFFGLARIQADGGWDTAFTQTTAAIGRGSKIIGLADGRIIEVAIEDGQYCTEKNVPAWADCVGSFRPTEKLLITVMARTGAVTARFATTWCATEGRGTVADIAVDRSGRLLVAGNVSIGDGALRDVDRPSGGKLLQQPPICIRSALARIDLAEAKIDIEFSRRFDPKHLAALTTEPIRSTVPVQAVLPMGDDSLVIGGSFTHVDGRERRHIAWIDSDGMPR